MVSARLRRATDDTHTASIANSDRCLSVRHTRRSALPLPLARSARLEKDSLQRPRRGLEYTMATPATTTKTDPDQDGSRWGCGDEVIRLRVWASTRTWQLSTERPTLVLGASADCDICVDDPTVSREHLQLTYAAGIWTGTDDDSKNGTRVDGTRVLTFDLLPGCELAVGGVRLIAETQRWIALREFLCRILGWSKARAETVDLALRSIRNAALGHGPLYINAPIDPAPIAQSLNRYVWGIGQPFVMSDPRRMDTDEAVRGVTSKPTALEAFADAYRGTMCVRGARRPTDLRDALRKLGPSSRVLLVIADAATRLRYPADVFANPPIEIPSLDERTAELPRIVDEYLIDAAAELALSSDLFTEEDRDWTLKHAVTSLCEIEKATLRLLALRASDSETMAAARLGMSQVALSRWFGRRGLPASLARKFHN